ncbi:TonB-dependent receptor domain-containing protein [Steroidobacter sp.]|uniref:TonB-dependent receptor domain-containing protein n=1 Tax=Steroidobacter sp. TaxID=1978227 RepID=UPI001A4DA042|nr:TonB-dependent receptor [Steroidobacter sp.]MBL8268312.1 TonB-dependent receptor [Steroidobacter sp.]
MIVRLASRSAATAVSIALLTATPCVAQADAVWNFKLPAQALADSLRAVGGQASTNVFFEPKLVADYQAPALDADLTVGEALGQLLNGTGLTFRYLDENTIAIVRPLPVADAKTTAPSTTKIKNRSVLASLSAFALSVLSAPTHAQQSTTTDVAPLDEVIVTAQKRSESVMDVPLSITTLGAVELEALRAQNIEDFAFEIPNATFTSTGTASPRVVLRGTNNDGGRFSPIAVTIDDSSFGTVDMRPILQSQVFDVERIEVLRGPQGTLTGSSSLGGTLNIITARPNTEEFSFKGTLDYGRFSTVLQKAVVNVPVSDTFAFRTVAYTESSDGAVRNVGPGGGTSSKNNFGARVSSVWQATEDLEVTAALSYEDLRYGMDTALYLDRFPGGNAAATQTRATLAGLGGNYYDDQVSFIERAGTNGGNVKVDDPTTHRIDTLLGSLRLKYQFDAANVELIYGHLENSLKGSQDVDYSEFAGIRSHYFWDNRSDSVELRLSSNSNGAFSWVTGVTYGDDRMPQGGRVGRGARDYAGTYALLQAFRTYRSVETKAVFGNIFWDIAPRLHLSAGARFTELTSVFGNAAVFVEGAPVPAINKISGTLEQFDPRVALSFDLNDDMMLYAQYATGFRPGYGNNPIVVGPRQTLAGPAVVPGTVDSEYATNYEVGFKGMLFDGRLALTAALFYMDYDDLQVTGSQIVDPVLSFFSYDVNAGSGRSQGFELEATARVSDGWRLHSAVGYVDAELEGVQGNAGRFDSPGIRPWTANVSTSYERAINDEYTGNFRLGYNWQHRAYARIGTNRAYELPEFGVLNLSAGVSNGRWGLTAYMDNVTDEVYWIGYAGTDLRGTKAVFVPRTFGLRLNVTL